MRILRNCTDYTFAVLALLMLGGLASAQTTVYLRSSAPAAVPVSGISIASPTVITTQSGHGFSPSCTSSYNVSCLCTIQGVSAGAGVSTVNGPAFECSYVDATNVALYTLAGSAVANSDSWTTGNQPWYVGPNAQWLAHVTPFTLNLDPIGWIDGPTGQTMRKLALTPQNGLATTSGIVVSGSGNHVITVTTSGVNPLTFFKVPIAAGQYFSIHGGPSALNTGCSAGNDYPWQVASVSSTGWTAAGCSGLSNGDYTNYATTCGPSSNQSCSTVSFVGQTNNPWWVSLRAAMSSLGLNSSPNYMSTFDCSNYATMTGCGSISPQSNMATYYALAALSLYVDPGNSLWQSEVLYGLNYDFRGGGVGYSGNEAAGEGNSNSAYAYEETADGLSILAGAAKYLLPWPGKSAFVSRTYNDLDDPTVAACIKTNQDASSPAYYSGTVNTSGKTVSWVGSSQFTGINPGWGVTINGVGYVVAAVGSPTVLTLTSSAGTQSSVAYSISGHNWVQSSGNLAAGTNDATHMQLPIGDPCFNGSCNSGTGYVGTVAQLSNSPGAHGNSYNSYTYGRVTAHSAGGVLTVSSWINGSNGAGVTPALDNIVSATYTSGITFTGTNTAGTSCTVVVGNAWLTVPLTGTNTIASGTPMAVVGGGSGFSSGSPPTSGNVAGYYYETANCNGTATISAVVGTPYTIFDTFTLSTTAAGPAIATFATTSSFTGTMNTGDELVGMDGWGITRLGSYFESDTNGSYVAAIGPAGSSGCGALTASQLCVINSASVSASTSVPYMAWRLPQFSSGDCGRIWLAKHTADTAKAGVSPSVYIPYPANLVVGSPGSWVFTNTNTNGGGGAPSAYPSLDFAMASDDTRAGRDLTRLQSWEWDFGLGTAVGAWTGFSGDGSAYSTQANSPEGELMRWSMAQSVASFPSLAGPWTDQNSIQLIYQMLPDRHANSTWFASWGGGYQGIVTKNSAFSNALAFSGASFDSPGGNNASLLQNWATHSLDAECGSSGCGSFWGGAETQWLAKAVLHNDPAIGNLDYTTQPLQYIFNTSSPTLCTSLFASPGCTTTRQDTVVSHYPDWTTRTGSLLLFDSHTVLGTGGWYDAAGRNGDLMFYQANCLLGTDQTDCGGDQSAVDAGVLGQGPQIGGQQYNYTYEYVSSNPPSSFAYTPIKAWSAANAGSWGSQYGDSQSRYVYASSDLSAIFAPTLPCSVNYWNRSVFESKPPTGDHFIFQADDESTGSCVTQAVSHIHYRQTGQLTTGANLHTGTTICVNSSYTQVACSGLNTSDYIEEPESGLNTPADTFGLMSWFSSPGTITPHWDIPGVGNAPQACAGGACGAVNTYPGGYGYSNRVTIAAGAVAPTQSTSTVSIGLGTQTFAVPSGLTLPNGTLLNIAAANTANSMNGTVTSYSGTTLVVNVTSVVGSGSFSSWNIGAAVSGEQSWLIVHKVMTNLTDTTIVPTALSPDANWYGAYVTGANSTAVYLQGRGNTTHSVITSFTTTFSGQGNWLIAGLTPGTYTLTVGGTQVFTGNVSAGDTSIYATSTGGGVVALSQTGAVGGPFLNGAVKIGGSFTIGR